MSVVSDRELLVMFVTPDTGSTASNLHVCTVHQ